MPAMAAEETSELPQEQQAPRSQELALWVDAQRGVHEPEKHWGHRREFILRNLEVASDDISLPPPAQLNRLLAFSMVWANHVFMGCRYPVEIMEKVLKMGEGIEVNDAPTHTTRDELVSKVKKRGISSSNEGVEQPCKKKVPEDNRASVSITNNVDDKKAEIPSLPENLMQRKQEKGENSPKASSSAKKKDTDLGAAPSSNANQRDAHLGTAPSSGTNQQDAHLETEPSSGTNQQDAHLGVAPSSGTNQQDAHLEAVPSSGTNQQEADLEAASFLGANQRDAYLEAIPSSGANQRDAHLEAAPSLGANQRDTQLGSAPSSGTNQRDAHLGAAASSGTNQRDAHLGAAASSGTNQRDAHLGAAASSGTNQRDAHLGAAASSGTNQRDAHLGAAASSGTNQRDAHLGAAASSGTNQRDAHLGASLSSGSNQRDAHLVAAPSLGTSQRDAHLVKAPSLGASQRDAHLVKAPSLGASHRDAHLGAAPSSGVKQRDAHLGSAPSSGTNQRDVHVRTTLSSGANQRDAYLGAALPSGTNQRDAHLGTAQPLGANQRSTRLGTAQVTEPKVGNSETITRQTPAYCSAVTEGKVNYRSSQPVESRSGERKSISDSHVQLPSRGISQAAETSVRVHRKLTADDAKERQTFFNRLYKTVAWRLVSVGGFSPTVNHAEILKAAIVSLKAALDVVFVPLKELADLPQNKSSPENVVCELRCKSVYLGTGCGKSQENAKAVASREALKLFLKKKVVVKICKRKYNGKEIEDLVLLDEDSRPSNLPPALRNPQDIL
ncbi:CDKN2A-interacting protein [Rhinatrema bivittatum]|uniref:CDKN2A-interacting protein n=1 Tax=Rhinatrema bivittatum TaxID=194408 RepID=UPI001129F76A|nr:CDKN2A-interacting protein [Rhinatrema bivittatum]